MIPISTNPNWKRNVFLFIFGQGITLFGSTLVHFAIMWHITLETQSGLMMTLIAASAALPMFFISPFAGVWADRYNKKLLINISDAIIALITLGMAILFAQGTPFVGLLLICLVARAFGQGVQMPAVNALIPELVPQEHLTRVNGANSTMQSLVMLASPMVSGALIMAAPIYFLLLIDVVTATIGISILLFLVKVPSRIRTESGSSAKQYFLEIGEGLKYIKGQPFLKKTIMLSALFNFMAAPVSILTVLQVVRNWGDEAMTLFDVVAFGAEQRLAAINIVFSAGMILGGLLISTWGGFRNRSHTMALSLCLFGAGTLGLGLIGDFWIYLLCMGVTGVVMALFSAPMMATLQINVDAQYMGRVFSVLTMFASVMMPLGMVIWGPLGDIVPIEWLLIFTGPVLFFMGLVYLLDKALLKAGEAEEGGRTI